MRKINKVFVILLIFAALSPVFGYGYDVADDKLNHNRKNKVETDIDRNGVTNKVTLLKDETRDFTNYDIVKDAKLKIEENGQVFLASINEPICYNSSGLDSVSVGEGKDSFIAVSSCVPQADDDWQLMLYSFDGKGLTEQLKVTSNEPSIEIKDSDNDGMKDIVAMDRDYENDPEKDKFVTTYKYINGKWQKASVYRTKTKELKTLVAG
jgi:hypothetical protein